MCVCVAINFCIIYFATLLLLSLLLSCFLSRIDNTWKITLQLFVYTFHFFSHPLNNNSHTHIYDIVDRLWSRIRLLILIDNRRHNVSRQTWKEISWVRIKKSFEDGNGAKGELKIYLKINFHQVTCELKKTSH